MCPGWCYSPVVAECHPPRSSENLCFFAWPVAGNDQPQGCCVLGVVVYPVVALCADMYEVAGGVFPALAAEVPVVNHFSSTRAAAGR